jgi:Zn-dependent peptidase ImmA (M78 family)/transcriptional regulator with XRE-family HTH domain
MIQFLGSKLRKSREKMGLSQAAFARALGFSSEFISYLESGKRTPSFATLNRIAAFLNKDVAYFFYEHEAAPDSFTLLFRAEAVDERTRDELQKFRRYCDDYVRLETVTGRTLDLAPLYGNVPPERMADEERRRLGLGDEPIKDVFGLCEANGCRILRMPMPDASRVSGVFIYLEAKQAAFALVNSAQAAGRQVFSAAHEYCHYLKDRLEGPVIDNPDVFIDDYVALYHPREQFAQAFAARFLMPPSKIREMVDKQFHARRVHYDEAIYLKRYFGVSMAAMLRALRDEGFLEKALYEDYAKLDPSLREREVFGAVEEGEAEGPALDKSLPAGVNGVVSGFLSKFRKRPIPSDRYKLLQREAVHKVAGEKLPAKSIQKKLPQAEA